MANDTIPKTLLVAGLLCIVCSVLVSTAAVRLKPMQERNKALSTKKNILMAAGLMNDGINVEDEFSKIQVKIVDLESGEFDDSVDVNRYDQREAAKTTDLSVAIAPGEDIAKIGRRAKKAFVYLVMDGEDIETIILPIHGKGLWSTMYAFLALESDANTVKGLSFYEHGETPGLGGEVDNPLWKHQWEGKKIYNEDADLAVRVIKGKVNPSNPNVQYMADGLSGATLTTVGVNNLIRFWLGEDGFEKFLGHFRAGVENG